MTALAPLLQSFFSDRLMTQKHASSNTISSYRDTFKLLLNFAREQTGKSPSQLDISDLDASVVTAFLIYLETTRGNSPRTSNSRLAAIHSLFSYAALHHPEHSADIQRVLAIPTARTNRSIVAWLDHAEAAALLESCDQNTRTGRRDYAMFTLTSQTGLRVSELIGLNVKDLHLDAGAHVHCEGKGRKERCTPLLPETVEVMKNWIEERAGIAGDPLFTTHSGSRLSRDAVEQRLRVTSAKAALVCPSLKDKAVTPHVLRHTAAMRLLQAGVDSTVIALWLGHEQVSTTNVYIHADMTLKESAIAKVAPTGLAKQARYQPTDTVMAFLESL
ncbi:tyrosine-type recombinase/integrase [Glutamicibacter uratoxydans]|uniref:tyrosine-type recombinase/integrase n=1 Tax=Glutamicibacter uratoxydans TaxID=43667 RepID=UPI003D70225D